MSILKTFLVFFFCTAFSYALATACIEAGTAMGSGGAKEFQQLDSPPYYKIYRHLAGNNTLCYVVTAQSVASISCVGPQ